jgi:titin
VSNITNNSCDIEWKAPEKDGGSPITHYVVEIRESRRTLWGRVAKLDAKATSYTVPDLYVGNNYLLRVSAINAEGQGIPLESETITPRKKIGECC